MRTVIDSILLQLDIDGPDLVVRVDDASLGFAALRGSELPGMAEAVVDAANRLELPISERLDRVEQALHTLVNSRSAWEVKPAADRLVAAGAVFHPDDWVRARAAAEAGLPERSIDRVVCDNSSQVKAKWADNPDPGFDPHRERLLDDRDCAATAWRRLGMPRSATKRMLASVGTSDLVHVAQELGTDAPPTVFAEAFARSGDLRRRLELMATINSSASFRAAVWPLVIRRADGPTVGLAVANLGAGSRHLRTARDSADVYQRTVAQIRALPAPAKGEPDSSIWLNRLTALTSGGYGLLAARAATVTSVDPRERFAAAGDTKLLPVLRALLLCDPVPEIQVAASLSTQTWTFECMECLGSNHRGDGGYDCLLRFNHSLLDSGVEVRATDRSVPGSLRRIWPIELRKERLGWIRLNPSRYGKWNPQYWMFLTSPIPGATARAVIDALVPSSGRTLTTKEYAERFSQCCEFVRRSGKPPTIALRDFASQENR